MTHMKLMIMTMVILTSFGSAKAEVTVDKMFSDHMVLQRDLAVPIWGTAKAGEKITVTFRKQSKIATADSNGKWLVKLAPMKVGDATTLTVKSSNTITFQDVLIGEVWVGSGQSNMAGGVGGYMKNDPVLAKMVKDGPYPNLRLYGKSGWVIATPKTATSFSAIHFAFGCNLYKSLNVPVGLMKGAVGGTPSGRWLSPEMAHADKALMAKMVKGPTKEQYAQAINKWKQDAKKAKEAGKRAPRKPKGPTNIGDLYARFIQPFVPYGIRGVLWDQGESRTQLPGVDQYTTMNALINGWRKTWGQGDFHFLHIQKPSGGIAPWNAENPVNNGAISFNNNLPKNHITNPSSLIYPLDHIKIGTLKNAPLVTASDLGTGIHPRSKSGYGKRACRVALGVVYGKDIETHGPTYKSHKVEGAAIRITFDHIGKGLASRHADNIRGFEIAGEDGKWAWADAKIDGHTIVVSSTEIKKPTQVQYAFNRKNNFANLYNKDGLPAAMFTTIKH